MGRTDDLSRRLAELLGGAQRPAHRCDCISGPRPCPWIGCRYHLWPEVAGRGDLPDESCAIDVSDCGPLTLEQISELFGVTRERVRQIEVVALRRARLSVVLVSDSRLEPSTTRSE